MATRQILQTDWKEFLFFLQPTQGGPRGFFHNRAMTVAHMEVCFPGIFPVLFLLETEQSVSKIATQLLCCKFSPEKKNCLCSSFRLISFTEVLPDTNSSATSLPARFST